MQTAYFELRGWQYTGDGDNCATSVLGITWNKKLDTLSVNISFACNFLVDKCTKRLMLSMAQRVFDPIGVTCPAMLCPKLLLQKAWRENIDWDDAVSDDVRLQFSEWLKELPAIEDIKIPRRIGNISGNAHVSFHAFSDASGLAYAAAVFIRVEVDEMVEVQMIGAKSRIAPTKETTIPRLELLATVITACLFL